MAAIAETVRFCFPNPQADDTDDALPLHTNGRGPRQPRQKGYSLTQGEARMTPATLGRSYAFDWILVVVLWAVLFVLDRSGGHKREFSLEDKSIQHTFALHERVPPGLLAFISAGIPFIVMLSISTMVARNKWDVHNSILGLFMSYTMTGVVTQVIKMGVGRPRPDLINRCLPPLGATDRVPYGLVTWEICTSTDMPRLNDGFKSFPSGHSSLSFAGMGFLACYLAGKMHLWDRRGHRTRAWFALAPLLGGAMVAISRTEDNRHHWQDVLVGSLLGMFIAFVSYRTYYPPISHPACHLPLSPRDPDSDDDESDINDAAHRVRLLSEDRH